MLDDVRGVFAHAPEQRRAHAVLKPQADEREPGEWERTYRALQQRARKLLDYEEDRTVGERRARAST